MNNRVKPGRTGWIKTGCDKCQTGEYVKVNMKVCHCLLIQGMFVVLFVLCLLGFFLVLLLIIKGFLRTNGVVMSTCLIEKSFSLHHSQTNLSHLL